MRRTHKRLGSLLLVIAMLLTMLPVSAMAADGDVYAALAEAIADAPTNGTQTTVTLTGDIAGMITDQIITIQKGQNIVLDMDGHSITVDANNFEGRPFINWGTFTIQGNGTIDVTAAGENGWGPVNNYGTLTIENGMFRMTKATDTIAIWNRKGGVAYLNGGTFVGGASTIATEIDTYTEINGGQYENNRYPTIENRGDMLITGGTFKNTSCSSCDSRWGYTIRSGESSDTAYLKIQGATEDSVQVTGVQGGLAVIGGTADIYNGIYETVACETHTTGESAFYAGYFTGESYKTATTIYGGSFTSCSKTAVLVGNGNPAPDSGAGLESTVMIKGGTFVGGDTAHTAIKVNKTEHAVGAANITGGTFSSDVSEYVDPSSTFDSSTGTVTPNDKTNSVAEIDGKYYKSLSDAITSAKDGDTVTLLKDCGVGTSHIIITDGRSLTIDMNEKNINIEDHILAVRHGTMTFTGKGEIKAPSNVAFNVLGNQDPATWESTAIDAVLTIGPDVTVTSGSAPVYFAGKGAVANIYGTLVATGNAAAVQGNGTVDADKNKGGTVVNIYDGAVLTAPNSLGIYQPQSGTVNVYGGKITGGVTGIEMRAGALNISGGTIAGGTERPYSQSNGNGSTTWNAAVAVAQHTTKLPIKINITGGIFTGGAAIYESDPNDVYTDGSVKKPDVTVTGGDFDGTIYSQNCTDFISGGHFSEPVDEQYLDNRLNAELKSASNPEAPYSYYTSMNDAIAAAKPGDVVTPIQTGSTATAYTVTLNYNDGSAGSVACTVAGNTSIALPVPTRTGYNFLGWYDGSTKVSSPYQVTKNVTLVAQWSYIDNGGSYEPSGDYVVSVDKTVGGKVTVNPGRADKGDTVTITVKPDKGYELDSLIVTAKDGGAVKLTEKSANKFTFKMPGSKVTVEAVFVKEETKPVVTLPFADVNKGDWYYDAVEYVYENDLMNGTSATTFSPFVTTSRAMMLTILARYDGVDTSTGSTWYEAGAVWAIAEGVSDGTNLEADLTREQLVTMLWRYAGSPVVESDLSGYPDSASVSDWAVNAMIWAVESGVITGNGAGALNPQGTATRAEVATILMRFIEK